MNYPKTVVVLLASASLAVGLSTVLQAAEPAANASSFAAPTAQDKALQTQVSAALKADPGLAEARIEVAANEGVVTLRGGLRDADSVSRALALVASIEGVRRVENGLEVDASR